MNLPIINHIISFAKVRSIDKYLKRFEMAGFILSKKNKTVRHKPGKRNGFIYFGPEYLEFMWAEDKKKFNNESSRVENFFQNNPHPFGLAFECKDVDIFHRTAVKRHFILKPTRSMAPADGNQSDPWWLFQDIPLHYMPGAWTFALCYLKKDWDRPRAVRIGRNTLYAISGITFVSNNPRSRAEKWKKFISSRNKLQFSSNIYKLQHGPHILEWMNRAVFDREYAMPLKSMPKFRNMQDIALIHLLATDIKKSMEMLKKAGFKLSKFKDGFLIEPDKRDGFAFFVKEKKFNDWMFERAEYGQKIKLIK